MKNAPPTLYSTVSVQFISDWLAALRPLCTKEQFHSLLTRSGITMEHHHPHGRVTLDQIVLLYQLAAVETGDEMMGLWNRPIRPRALQHLLTSIREATSLHSALYRFSTFWNLLLDDYYFDLLEDDKTVTLTLAPHDAQKVQRFGHMLILKLAHGILSWLARVEVPIQTVEFAFGHPVFHDDYAVVFPAQVCFGKNNSSLIFDRVSLGPVSARSSADLDMFLKNAPRDWIFTRSSAHRQSLRVRAFLSNSDRENSNLEQAANALHMTPRTLIRRLKTDGTSFQAIKDGLRRDMAIRHLQAGNMSIEAIAQDIGFSSAANFHKAFQRWTGDPPSAYRRRS